MTERMTKENVPRSSGVFKPVGHVLLTLDDQAAAEQAESELGKAGFASEDLTRYSDVEMVEQCEHDIRDAGALASMGAEISLSRKRLEMAQQGCWFVVVHTPDDDAAGRVRDVADRLKVRFAQLFGRLTIEELVQTSESPRG
jgi:hypothetical protein